MSGDRTHSLHQVHISKSSFSPMKHWFQQSAVHQNELWLQCGGIADEHYCGGRGLQEGCGRDGRTGVWLQAGERSLPWRAARLTLLSRPAATLLSPAGAAARNVKAGLELNLGGAGHSVPQWRDSAGVTTHSRQIYPSGFFLKFYLQILPCQEWHVVKLVKYDQRRPRVEWRGSYGVRSGSAQTNNASRGRIVLCQGSVVWLTLLLPRLHKCWQCWCTIPLHRFTQPPSQLNFLSGHSRWEWERKNFSV